MVATLTSQLAEFMDENAERAYESLEKVLGRIEKVRQTVEGAEIYEVIRRRLFEDLGDEASIGPPPRRIGTCTASSARTCPPPAGSRPTGTTWCGVSLPPRTDRRPVRALGHDPEFQRTRGVLRLLADVISDQYQAKENDPLIQSSSINLGARPCGRTGQAHRLRQRVPLRRGQRHCGQDRQGPRDRPATGQRVRQGERGREVRPGDVHVLVQRRAAAGCDPAANPLAVLNPEMAPPFVSDALDRMTKRLWYLYQDSGLYRFESRPNLNRILVDREEMVRSEPDKVRDFAKSTLNDLIGDATFRVYRYPKKTETWPTNHGSAWWSST